MIAIYITLGILLGIMIKVYWKQGSILGGKEILSSLGSDQSKIADRVITVANPNQATERATVGGGCFWCIEAIFERIEGCVAVVSGYAGGHMKNPNYDAVVRGDTGHAEVVQITFLPEVITYEEILRIFWHAHDPSTLNRQGNDVGTQYRSIILAHTKTQLKIANDVQQQLNADKNFSTKPIVTQIELLDKFYPGENYHQDYYDDNPSQSYCRVVIAPKLTQEKIDWLRSKKKYKK